MHGNDGLRYGGSTGNDSMSHPRLQRNNGTKKLQEMECAEEAHNGCIRKKFMRSGSSLVATEQQGIDTSHTQSALVSTH